MFRDRPNDISTRILHDNKDNKTLAETIKREVLRHQRENDKECRRTSTETLRRQIAGSNPSISEDRILIILAKGLQSSNTLASRSPTALDLARAARKSGIRARKNARR